MPIKLMAASRRRPGLTRADYFRYIEHYHGTVARRNDSRSLAIFRITSSTARSGRSPTPVTRTRRSTAKVSSSCISTSFATCSLRGSRRGVTQSRANQDGRFFADEPTNIIVMAEEVEIPVSNPGPRSIPAWVNLATVQSKSCSTSCASRKSSHRTTTECGVAPMTRPWASRRTHRRCFARWS